jgi:hypothetical protein
VRLTPESLCGMFRNHCAPYPGITVRHRPDFATSQPGTFIAIPKHNIIKHGLSCNSLFLQVCSSILLVLFTVCEGSAVVKALFTPWRELPTQTNLKKFLYPLFSQRK